MEDTCNICYGGLESSSQYISCENCHSKFHRDHLAAWLLNNLHCPVCRQDFTTKTLSELKPKTKKETYNLREINLRLNDLSAKLDQLEQINKRKNPKLYSKKKRDIKRLASEQIYNEMTGSTKDDSIFKKLIPVWIFIISMTLLVYFVYFY